MRKVSPAASAVENTKVSEELDQLDTRKANVASSDASCTDTLIADLAGSNDPTSEPGIAKVTDVPVRPVKTPTMDLPPRAALKDMQGVYHG